MLRQRSRESEPVPKETMESWGHRARSTAGRSGLGSGYPRLAASTPGTSTLKETSSARISAFHPGLNALILLLNCHPTLARGPLGPLLIFLDTS